MVKFLEIAQEEDFYIVLRPGPYICAERDNVTINKHNHIYNIYLLLSSIDFNCAGRPTPLALHQVPGDQGAHQRFQLYSRGGQVVRPVNATPTALAYRQRRQDHNGASGE